MLVTGATGLGPVNIQENNHSGAKSPHITSNSTRPSTDWPGGWENKVNLRDSIAATGLIILPKLDPNPFFYQCDIAIWRMTSKHNREHFPCPKKLCVPLRSPPIIGIGVTNRKRSNRSQIASFSPRVTLKFDRWITIRKRTNRVKIGDLLSHLKIWQKTFKNNSIWWIETEVTVRKWRMWIIWCCNWTP